MKKIILFLALAAISMNVSAQNRVYNQKLPDSYQGTGASVYDLDSETPEEATGIRHKVVVDTVAAKAVEVEPLIPNCSVDEKYVLQAEASAPLDKVEIVDANGKVLRSTGLHHQTKASIDLNVFPKETLVFRFYGVNGNTQEIELSH